MAKQCRLFRHRNRRHTLATELLGAGASFETVADILGNSVEIVKKHYAKWSKERQERVDGAMEMVHGEALKISAKQGSAKKGGRSTTKK